ncbi:MAG: hypothetical protein IJF11_06310 [Clostridia bacterium]|nr:hypothetical protein [Clostridia bacterium]
MNNRKTKREIREALGLPNDNGKIIGLVSEDPYELCENTMTSNYKMSLERGELERKRASERGFSSSVCQDGTPFDYGASGGATSPNTEVNADHQGVISEVPRCEKKPKSKG